MLQDTGPMAYPVGPVSPGESIFEQASAAQVRIDQRHEQEEKMEAAGKPMAWSSDSWKDFEAIEERNNLLADPFHCNPDDYHPGRK
jgi:hypothetical protein